MKYFLFIIFGCVALRAVEAPMVFYPLSDLSTIPTLTGGFSGLHFESSSGDELIFWSHSDRGPNLDEIEENGTTKRPFLDPDFVPYWVRFSVNRRTKATKLVEVVHLSLPDGTPISGLPNKDGDEIPVDSSGRILDFNINGIDPESICFDGEHVWMGEEYGPSLLKFSPDGTLIRRYVPEGTYPGTLPSHFKHALPAKISERKVNRGFEGLACNDGKVFMILQSPLAGEKTDVRLLEFDPKTETVARQHVYRVDSKETDKIGDLAVWKESLLVLEQNGETGSGAKQLVYAVNLSEIEDGALKKTLAVNLSEVGYDFAEKVEGLSVVDGEELAVVNDNDFGIHGPEFKTVLGLIKL